MDGIFGKAGIGFAGAALAMMAALGVGMQNAGAAIWSDTELQVLYGKDFQEPFNPNDVAKTIVTLQHASGWEYGRNFFFVDALKSDEQDNAAGEIYGETSTGGISTASRTLTTTFRSCWASGSSDPACCGAGSASAAAAPNARMQSRLSHPDFNRCEETSNEETRIVRPLRDKALRYGIVTSAASVHA